MFVPSVCFKVLVVPSTVTLRWWPISFHLGANARPGEKKVPAEDYRYDTRTRDDIKYNLGEEVEARVFRLTTGMTDPLTMLPKKILGDILKMLDLQSLHQVGCCNSYLHELASSNELWEKIYLEHHGWASDELRLLAAEMSWKKVFFLNKLQLQVILSRRRRQSSAGAERTGTSTFITS